MPLSVAGGAISISSLPPGRSRVSNVSVDDCLSPLICSSPASASTGDS
jgi:hypothetical protein